jgi:predicted amidophosphoribosyltransferase
MEVPLLMIVGLAVCAVFLAIAFLSTGLGRKTCCECGGDLPVIRLSNRSGVPALGDWACPKCGTRFDHRGRARGQVPT